ncbi:hypothetical protein ACLESO_57755, partial [Pyxidicoccus sp. 3LG]
MRRSTAAGLGVPLEGVHLFQRVRVEVQQPLGLHGAGDADHGAAARPLLGVHGHHEVGVLHHAQLGEGDGASAEEEQLGGAGAAPAGHSVRVAGEHAEHQGLLHVLGAMRALALVPHRAAELLLHAVHGLHGARLQGERVHAAAGEARALGVAEALQQLQQVGRSADDGG